MLKVITPSGIGDISWIYSKLVGLAEQGREIGILVSKDLPNRAGEFVKILPHVEFLGYSDKEYLEHDHNRLDRNCDLSALEDNDWPYVINMNPYLEAGYRIENIFPKQKTYHHYPIRLQATDIDLPSAAPKKLNIGVYCSSYKHRPNAQLYSVDEWVELIDKVDEYLVDYGYSVNWVFIGASYDDKTLEVHEAAASEGFKTFTCFDKSISQALLTIKCLDYFFSFPSGLGVLGDVLNTPTMMWYWANKPEWAANKGFFNSYPDKDNIVSGRYLILPYVSVEHSFLIFENYAAWRLIEKR